MRDRPPWVGFEKIQDDIDPVARRHIKSLRHILFRGSDEAKILVALQRNHSDWQRHLQFVPQQQLTEQRAHLLHSQSDVASAFFTGVG